MSIPRQALDLENRSIGRGGEPTFSRAYQLLLAEWRAGVRNRELGLHLMFLAWYLLCEPPFLTGLDKGDVESSGLSAVFREVHEHFLPTISDDPEMLYAVGLMAQLFPYVLGDEEKFEALSREYLELFKTLAPRGLPSNVF